MADRAQRDHPHRRLHVGPVVEAPHLVALHQLLRAFAAAQLAALLSLAPHLVADAFLPHLVHLRGRCGTSSSWVPAPPSTAPAAPPRVAEAAPPDQACAYGRRSGGRRGRRLTESPPILSAMASSVLAHGLLAKGRRTAGPTPGSRAVSATGPNTAGTHRRHRSGGPPPGAPSTLGAPSKALRRSSADLTTPAAPWPGRHPGLAGPAEGPHARALAPGLPSFDADALHLTSQSAGEGSPRPPMS
jgi:hypothetical protein